MYSGQATRGTGGAILGAAKKPAPDCAGFLREGSNHRRYDVIITVTANAAVDKTLTVHNFQTGFRHRASESLTLPGGKGVNIARALKTLGQPVIVTGLVGGRAGQQIVEGLQRENILNDLVHIGGESRTSTAVVDPTAVTQTEIIEYGPVVTPQEIAAIFDKAEYLAKGARFVILAGSLPRKVPEDFYTSVMQRIRRHRCFIVLDSAGEPLRLGMRGRPHLVTPNLREAEDLVGHEFHDEQDVIDASGMICDMGARNTIIKTSYGCVARFQIGRRHRVFRGSITPLESVVSTVGSGDAFLAGFVSARFQKLDLPECLRLALATGAANTQRYGAGVLDLDEAERLLDTTEIIEVQRAGRSRA
jgi:1-phosphofructokinase family hexose kinase